MVRYPVGRQELIDLINTKRPTWIGRAQTRTAAYALARDYTGGSEFWGEIKDVYIQLQHEKCAYCETKLQGAQYASKVHEVEHYRPKQSVKAWPNLNLTYLANFQAAWATGAESQVGYYQLPYHPFNYAIACTRCNSTLKSNYFPIRGPRDVAGSDPTQMYGESALLIYPISDIDEDPGDLITGLDSAGAVANVEIFHAGTAFAADKSAVQTAGGRVLGVTATGDDLAGALASAYSAAGKISFDGMQFRRDIGRTG